MRGVGLVRSRERGIVLFIALIVLVAMTLAGLALIRSSATGILAAGNLGFRQNATISGDAGVEAAVTWLRNQTAVALQNDMLPAGYHASWDRDFNPFTFNWGANVVSAGPADAAGNSVLFVIHRMCEAPGSPTAVPCVTLSGTGAGAGSSKGGAHYGDRALTRTSQVYYRITAQVTGPRNALSYVQTMIY